MALFRNGVLGSALLMTAVVLAPACDDDPVADEPTGGSGGSGGSSGSTAKGGSTSKGGSTGHAGATGEGGSGGAPTMCEEIGELCHTTGGDPMVDECHELGHVGDEEVCAERYDDCITLCTEYLEGLAGAGGAAHGHAGAGGESHGGSGGHGGA